MGRYEPQSHAPPFIVYATSKTYTETDTLTVIIEMKTAERFRGFAIQARRAGENDDQDEPIGIFENAPGSQIICNFPMPGKTRVVGNGLTNTNDTAGSQTPKSSISFKWKPGRSHGHLKFRATVILDETRYWVAEPSHIVLDELYPVPATTTKPPNEASKLEQISGDICARGKSCYRNPPGCDPQSNCDIFGSWAPSYVNDRLMLIDFELVAQVDAGWVALGLSHDKKMGDDVVFECVWRQKGNFWINRTLNTNDKTNIYLPKTDYRFTQESVADMENRRIRCQFTYITTSRDDYKKLTNTSYHILLAKGHLKNDGSKDRHLLEPGKYPYVSTGAVKLTDRVDLTYTARYPLVKAHGILMIIGWMMCASTALILAKYYKPMWPNNRICGVKVWFANHRGLMIVSLFATVIAFIIIFVHCDGYSKMPDLPAKAHPILGIITTILCVLNPLIAICKCSEKSDKRPIFNWIHWFIGTCATVLATPTLFIGMNLPKAHVPWWVTWVLVAFMLFHLIVELMLEIHGCLNANKQKYRTQEYEMRKPKGDREPDPVGTRFKTIILAIYVPVVIILGLVVIIAIAAG